ncbi:hypothetical protein Pdw03_2699 [Penicillium digitatum]|uniref:Uncharacterized protein n=1 Tax=Penicillium digitatum TaxID=36651 RepID=A0A7T7BHD7_PENDI|nr:hypothetical protein Pdw03_2699 [Penicillium digitatum]
MEYPEPPIEEVPRTPSPPSEPPDSDTESFTADTTNSATSAMPCEPFPMGNLDRKLQLLTGRNKELRIILVSPGTKYAGRLHEVLLRLVSPRVESRN